MKTTIYNQKGESVGKISLPEGVFEVSWNPALVHQVVVSMQSNARTPVAHTKDRGDVRGGGKKPWKQKGTGRARHGSIRSPLWRGGGVTFGPRNDKNYSKKINKKMRAKALMTVLSQKMRDGEIMFLDTLDFDAPKTVEAKTVLSKLSTIENFANILTKKHNSVLLAMPSKNVNVEKSFANFGNLFVDAVMNLNPVSVLRYKYLIFVNPEESIKQLQSRITK